MPNTSTKHQLQSPETDDDQDQDGLVDANAERTNPSDFSEDEVEDAEDGQNDNPISLIVAPIDELKTVLAAELSTDTTQHYLNQIGTRPLFSVAEELHYATLAKQGNFEARQK